ncbi:hypothetical protein C8R45DRAFT_1148413 [Mycena sanguinolenta]|nr:hypothetical protein C8R45DRAFT_1148413 [Mycena sanguinolenta]
MIIMLWALRIANPLRSNSRPTQDLIESSLADLKSLSSRIVGLSLFSPNEILEDISTRDLIYLLVPASGRYTLKIPPKLNRDLKIKQYQPEKDLRARIETIRKRRGQRAVDGATESDFDLISSLLLQKPEGGAEEEEEDSESDDILQLELLQNAPRMPPPSPSRPGNDRRGKERAAEGDMWKLDAPSPRGGPDEAQVFGPGHRLPTRSIDYLQIQQKHGNILTGGGPGSENALTSSEQLALDVEMDGSKDGAEKDEMKRLKDENWAQFTDENPRGAGNTMSRG